MAYYHVRLAKKIGVKRIIYAFDLPKKQLMTEIAVPFGKLKPFMCGHSLVQPTDVEQIRIVQTEAASSAILKKAKWKRIARRILGPLAGTRSAEYYRDEWFVFDAGKDVTRDFIKGFNLPKDASKTQATGKNVFIVHGKDHKPLKELKAMLKGFGLNPIVLHEKASGSRTIVEKLEKYSDVGYAFVVLTPDDIGALNKDTLKELAVIIETTIGLAKDVRRLEKIKLPFGTLSSREAGDYADAVSRITTEMERFSPENIEETRQKLSAILSSFRCRARQNVVLEFGYFIGLLERDRVCCLYKGDVELPSDMHGIVYMPFEESVDEVRDKVIKELEEAGYKIKM